MLRPAPSRLRFFTACAFAAAVAASACVHQRAERRRAEIAEFAQRSGFEFSAEERTAAWPFEVFERGFERYGRLFLERLEPDLVAGLGDGQLILFEHHHDRRVFDNEGGSMQSFWNTCCLAEFGLELGSVRIRPAGLGDRLQAGLGLGDIEVGNAEFDAAFEVTAERPEDALALLGPGLVDVLLGAREWTFEAADDLLLIHRSGRADADRFDALVRLARGIGASLPAGLIERERVRRGLPAPDASGGR